MKYKVTLILIAITTLTFAQEIDLKFGEVDREIIAQPEHPLDNEAEAAILYKKERLFYNFDPDKGFSSTREVHLRLKIYRKSGLDWGTITIPLYFDNNAEQKVYGIKGITYNLQGNSVVEEKLKNSSVFTENIHKYKNQVSISMPNVKEGSVIDLVYEINSNLIGYMDLFVVQYGIPVDYVDIDVDVPEYFNFKKHIKGFYPIELVESSTKKTLNFQYRKDPNRLASVGGGYERPTLERGSLDFSETEYRMKAKNIPALKKENFTDNIENYRSAISFELESTKFPNEGYKIFNQTWEDVAKVIYQYDDFGGELNKNKVFKKEIEELMGKYSKRDQLAKAIFNYVKNRMAWNGYLGVSCEKGIKKAFDEEKGNVADINLMLTTFFRLAGFNANPVLVSTKEHGIPLFPTTNGFNYVLAAIEDDDNTILYDATEKVLGVNELPNRAINWNGRLIREDGTSKAISLVPTNASQKTIFVNAQISENGYTNGEMQTRLTDQLAYEYRRVNIQNGEDEIKNQLISSSPGLHIEKIETANIDQLNMPLVQTISFSKEGDVEKIGDNLYFNPMLFLAEDENPFKLESRAYPIDFVFPQFERINISIAIPDGYRVESLPENMAIGLPDNGGIFNFVIKEIGNTIQLTSSKKMNVAIISQQLYQPLKEFYNQMILKQNEKVMLSRM